MANWGGGAKGAAGGAMTGAAIGSVAGPYGTASGAGVGAVAGGLYGMFGGDSVPAGMTPGQRAEYLQYIRGVQARGAPQAVAAGAGNSDLRANQLGLIGQLEATASGKGPS